MANPERVTGFAVEVPAELDRLGDVRGPFLAFLQEHGVLPEDVDTWSLIFTEAFVNAIKHGSDEKADAKIQVSWRAQKDGVCLEIQDLGKGIPPGRLKNASLPDDPLSEGGRGLFLIRNFCDAADSWILPDGGGHLLRLHRSHSTLDAEGSMEKLVESTFDELNSSFESLSAFYRLGQALIESERVSGFIESALKDLYAVVPSSRHFLGWKPVLDPSLFQELEGIDSVVSWHDHEAATAFYTILQEGKDLIFESFAESEDYPGLRNYPVGCCLPIRAGDRVLGYLGVVRDSESAPLLARELNTLRTFADLFGISVAHSENAMVRSREQQALREVEIAADLQEKLVPTATPNPSNQWEIFLRRQGARSVSGDYAEAIEMPDGDLLFIMVDVMGKGVSAAFVAGMLRTAFRQLMALDSDLRSLMDRLNLTLCKMLEDLTFFSTVALIRVDLNSKQVHLVNAGHCPILIQEQGKALATIGPSGPPLGLFETQEYLMETIPLTPGQRILIFTDGVYEWEIEPGKIWGCDAFMETVESYRGPIGLFWDKVQNMREEQGNQSSLEDDQTLLYWEYKG